MPLPLAWPPKYTEELLDYQLDWTRRLQGDIISNTACDVLTGNVTITNHLTTNTTVTIWLSGGDPGSTSQVQCIINTAGGRTMEEIVMIQTISDPTLN